MLAEKLRDDRFWILEHAFHAKVHVFVQCFAGSTDEIWSMFPEPLGDFYSNARLFSRTETSIEAVVIKKRTVPNIKSRPPREGDVLPSCIKTKLRVTRTYNGKSRTYIVKHLAFSEWPVVPRDEEASQRRMTAYLLEIRKSRGRLPKSVVAVGPFPGIEKLARHFSSGLVYQPGLPIFRLAPAEVIQTLQRYEGVDGTQVQQARLQVSLTAQREYWQREQRSRTKVMPQEDPAESDWESMNSEYCRSVRTGETLVVNGNVVEVRPVPAWVHGIEEEPIRDSN